MDLTVGAHRGAAALDSVASEWDELLQRIPKASAFATPGWARAWWRTYGRHHEPVILEVRDGARLVALLPLQVSHVRGVGMRVLEMLGGSPAEWRIWLREPYGLGFKYVNELLVEPGFEPAVLQAVRAFPESGELRWDSLRFTCVPPESALALGFGQLPCGWSA